METTTVIDSGKKWQVQNRLTRSLLVCGILSSLLYVAMNIFIPLQYAGYSSRSQTISELSAIDAPTRTLWVLAGIVYTLLVAAYGWGVWKSAGDNRRLRTVGILLIIYGVIGIGWPLAPMHQREVLAEGGGTMSDSMHIVFSIVTVMLMLVAMGFGAASSGKGFRIYSILTIVTLLLLGILTGSDAPRLEANVPTPWLGVWERIMIGVFLLWVIVLAVLRLRVEDGPRPLKQVSVR
jgi:hypothetical protein